MTKMSKDMLSPVVKHMHDMVLIFEARNSNPDGDPDAGGMARMRPGTNIGQVSSGCMKRKWRTTIQRLYGKDDPRYARLYIDLDASLNAKEGEVAEELFGITAKELQGQKAKKPEMVKEYITEMCNRFFDIRLFGAVLTQSLEKVRGPVQVAIAESASSVEVIHHKVARQAIATDKELLEEGKENMFGDKSVVAYGLYCAHIYVTPDWAEKTGMTEEDLEHLIQSIIHMFDNDKSDIRPDMRVRALYDFEHLDGDQTLRHQTVECVQITPVEEVANGSRIAESIADFIITADTSKLPETIKMTQLL